MALPQTVRVDSVSAWSVTECGVLLPRTASSSFSFKIVPVSLSMVGFSCSWTKSVFPSDVEAKAAYWFRQFFATVIATLRVL